MLVPLQRTSAVLVMIRSKSVSICNRFYAPQLVPPDTAEARTSYGISVRLSVRLSRPGTDLMPGEIETPGLHHMVAWSI